MNKIAFEFDEPGEYAPRDGYETVERENIAAIIKYKNKYLLLKYNNTNYSLSLVTGGIEKEEDKVEAVKREVVEETGYNDIKSITPIDCVNISRFFVEHKKQNRVATYYPFLVELNSLKQVKVAEEEIKEHSFSWISDDDLENVDMFENHRRMLSAAKKMSK
jgi:8-oxo-dGTP pyrophosphatase MutT (NUDIX family)